jgi:hypothetical protein
LVGLHGAEACILLVDLASSGVAHTQGILGEAKPNATLDAIAHWIAVKLFHRLGSRRNILEFNKTQRSVLLNPEAKPFVSMLLGEKSFELILGSADRKIANPQGIAGWIPIR